jgi:hypothetical protein
MRILGNAITAKALLCNLISDLAAAQAWAAERVGAEQPPVPTYISINLDPRDDPENTSRRLDLGDDIEDLNSDVGILALLLTVHGTKVLSQTAVDSKWYTFIEAMLDKSYAETYLNDNFRWVSVFDMLGKNRMVILAGFVGCPDSELFLPFEQSDQETPASILVGKLFEQHPELKDTIPKVVVSFQHFNQGFGGVVDYSHGFLGDCPADVKAVTIKSIDPFNVSFFGLDSQTWGSFDEAHIAGVSNSVLGHILWDARGIWTKLGQTTVYAEIRGANNSRSLIGFEAHRNSDKITIQPQRIGWKSVGYAAAKQFGVFLFAPLS